MFALIYQTKFKISCLLNRYTYSKASCFPWNDELYVSRHSIFTHSRLHPRLTQLITGLDRVKTQHFGKSTPRFCELALQLKIIGFSSGSAKTCLGLDISFFSFSWNAKSNAANKEEERNISQNIHLLQTAYRLMTCIVWPSVIYKHE